MPFKNPEDKIEYNRTYRNNEEHKALAKTRCQSDKYKEYRKTKITCSCGLEITNHQMSEHKKTQKHIKLLNALPQIELH